MAHQAGGRVRVTIDGVNYPSRQSPSVKPARLQNSVYTNHDGTISFGTMPQPATAEMSFDVGPANVDRFDGAFMLGFHNITILEIDRGVLHQFTNAKVIGEPAINMETGEVTGLSIASEAYLRSKA